MSKFYCGVGHKWCKFCRNVKTDGKKKTSVCIYSKKELSTLDECPRLDEIKTLQFHDLLQTVDFDKVFDHIIDWWPEQKKNEEGYRKVYDKLQKIKPRWPKLGDMRIVIEKEEWDGKVYPNVSGRYPTKDLNYGIEFTSWEEWISMYFTEETLTTFTHEEIVGACLYEMTFYGFDDTDVQQALNEMYNEVEEIRNKS